MDNYSKQKKLLEQFEVAEKTFRFYQKNGLFARSIFNFKKSPSTFLYFFLSQLPSDFLKIRNSKVVVADIFCDKKMSLPFPQMNSYCPYYFGMLGDEDEIRLTKYFIKNFTNDSVFYDIGANYGFYSCLAESIIDKGEIHAFEPSPVVFSFLEKNLKTKFLNNFAISDNNGEAVFFEKSGLGMSGGSSLVRNGGDKISVQVITLDDYVEKFSPPSFLKIDVEGAEDKVIKGGENFFCENSPIIAMEILEEDNANHINAFKRLLSYGYKPHVIDENGDLSVASNLSFDCSDNFIFKK